MHPLQLTYGERSSLGGLGRGGAQDCCKTLPAKGSSGLGAHGISTPFGSHASRGSSLPTPLQPCNTASGSYCGNMRKLSAEAPGRCKLKAQASHFLQNFCHPFTTGSRKPAPACPHTFLDQPELSFSGYRAPSHSCPGPPGPVAELCNRVSGFRVQSLGA